MADPILVGTVVVKIETTVVAIAAALGCTQYTAEEIIRRVFLSSQLVPLPPGFRYQTEVGITPYHTKSSLFLTVRKRDNSDSTIKDEASLLAYMVKAAASVMDLSTRGIKPPVTPA